MEKSTLNETKIRNARLLISLIQSIAPISRAELAKKTSLSKPTVSAICERLFEKGFLKEIGTAESSGGKRATLITLNNEFGVFACFDYSSWIQLKVVVIDINGKELYKKSFDLEKKLVNLEEQIEKVLKELKMIPFPFLETRLTVRGIISKGENKIIESLDYKMPDDFINKIERSLNSKVKIERYSYAACIYRWEQLGRPNDMVYVSLEEGMSLVIIKDGKIYEGVNGNAGEMTEILCPSSKGYKTLEEILSRNEIDFSKIEQTQFENIFQPLEYLIRMVTTLLDINIVVLGGRFGEMNERWQVELKKHIQLKKKSSRKIELTISKRDSWDVANGSLNQTIKTYLDSKENLSKILY